MSVDYQIVVSADNKQYIGWQAQLFVSSCLSRAGGELPTIVVHKHHPTAPLRPEFVQLRELGCPLVEAPFYVTHPLVEFPGHPLGHFLPRNEIGSLETIANWNGFEKEHVFFCETDMLFVRRPEFPSGAEIAAAHYSYLDYTTPRVAAAAKAFGVDVSPATLNELMPIGVPYLLSVHLLKKLAERWMAALDLFQELEWIDIMYAFGIALAAEHIQPTITRYMVDNKNQDAALGDASLIHYCYGDDRWSKRQFPRSTPLDTPAAALPSFAAGSIGAEIVTQLREAQARFGTARSA